MTLRNHTMLAASIAVTLAAAHGSALAQSQDRGRGIDPVDPAERTLPPGLRGELPPGHGGPVPGLTRRPFDCPIPGQGRESLFGLCPGATIFGPEGQSGVSHVAHVDFSAVDAIDGTPVETDPELEDPLGGRMMYFWIGSRFDFVLNAHGLEPETGWTLVHTFEGEAGATTAMCFASATVNEDGDLHLLASIDPENHIPADLDPFLDPDEADDTAVLDAGLTLVSSAEVDCETGALLPPPAEAVDPIHLVSDTGIRFVDVDVLVCPEDGGDDGEEDAG